MTPRTPAGLCGTPGTAPPEHDEASGGSAFEQLLIRISTLFAGARWHHVGGAVDRALAELLGFCCIDQAAIFEMLADNSDAYLRHVARVPGLPPFPAHFNYGESFPWAFPRVLRGELVPVATGDSLPPDARGDKASMRALALHSLLHVPLQVDGEVRFVLMVACACPAPQWSEGSTTRLKAIGEIFAHAISRAEAAGALLASQHDVRDTLDVVHLGRWEWDISADKLYLTDEAKHILGADVPNLATLIGMVDAADRAGVEGSIATARAQPGTRFKVRYSMRTPAGETRTVQQWHEVMFPGERTARLMATVQDITAFLNTEREVTELRSNEWHSARVAQTTLLVASLAHELCQPLAAILNNAQAGLRFLRTGNLSGEEMGDILTDIVASNKRANEVLGALRAMLRRQTTTRVTFEAADAVHDVLALVRSELMSEQIDVETALAEDCYLNADKTQIEQVLLNLIMNSIDAMRGARAAQRRLEIAVVPCKGRHVQVSVKDSGRGIPADKMAKVFEAFWTTKKQGLGMGLSVCRAIIESYGGRIWCENNDSGGVTFQFKLPAAGEPETSTAAHLG